MKDHYKGDGMAAARLWDALTKAYHASPKIYDLAAEAREKEKKGRRRKRRQPRTR